ncbi:MAG: hypothetical protein KDA24_28320, partial [Deltaproteobacteria bacterium]|nr:hypothetical protein [Deltaproteobacteria bacterium]
DDRRLPRVRQVFGWVPFEDDAAAYRFIQSRSNHETVAVIVGDPGVAELLSAVPSGATPAMGRPIFQTARAGRWEVTFEGDMPSVLALQEAWAPGWQLSLDGGAWVDAARVDHMFVGARVPAGRHTAVLRYRPEGLFAGSLLSLLALALMGFAVRRVP